MQSTSTECIFLLPLLARSHIPAIAGSIVGVVILVIIITIIIVVVVLIRKNHGKCLPFSCDKYLPDSPWKFPSVGYSIWREISKGCGFVVLTTIHGA